MPLNHFIIQNYTFQDAELHDTSISQRLFPTAKHQITTTKLTKRNDFMNW